MNVPIKGSPQVCSMSEHNKPLLNKIMRTQFVIDDHGKKLAVILPIKDYNKMVDDLEELEDIKLYDKAKKDKQEFIDAEQAFEEIEESLKTKDIY